MYNEKDFEKWKRYEQVRLSGKYNMITDVAEASKKAKLNLDDYRKICIKYNFIKNAIERKYGSVEAYMN